MPDAASVRLRPMTPEEYVIYRAGAERACAQELPEYAELLPDGLGSPQMHLWTAEAGDPAEPVGLGR